MRNLGLCNHFAFKCNIAHFEEIRLPPSNEHENSGYDDEGLALDNAGYLMPIEVQDVEYKAERSRQSQLQAYRTSKPYEMARISTRHSLLEAENDSSSHTNTEVSCNEVTQDACEKTPDASCPSLAATDEEPELSKELKKVSAKYEPHESNLNGKPDNSSDCEI